MDTTPHFPIYMDYGATTPVDPRVVDAMIPWLREHFGNPASRSHAWGWEAEEAVEKARADVAELIGADPREIVWTSGATESNNLALKGAAHFYKSKGKHLITVKTEHKAVLDTMRELERQGFEVTYLDVQPDGLVDLQVLRDAMRPDTILVSVMFVNNEIGVIQDIPAIGAMCRERGVLFHVLQAVEQALLQGLCLGAVLCHFFAGDAERLAHAHTLVSGQRAAAHATLVPATMHLCFESHARLASHVESANAFGTVGLV